MGSCHSTIGATSERPIRHDADREGAAPIVNGTVRRTVSPLEPHLVAGSIELRRGDEVVHRTRRREWIPNRAIHLPVAGVTSAVLHP